MAIKPTSEREPTKVARRIKAAMDADGLDYRDLAVKLGVSLSLAHAWATGGHDPTLRSLRRIAKRLKIDLGELIS